MQAWAGFDDSVLNDPHEAYTGNHVDHSGNDAPVKLDIAS